MQGGRRRLWSAGVLALACARESGSTGGGETAPTTTTNATSAGTTAAPTTLEPTTATASGSSSTPADSSDGAEAETGDPPAGVLEIWWIDTEGGAATLFVTPGGPVVLVDAGFPGDRDADRIAAVVQDRVGAAMIDVCIVTHYHLDHVGGVPDLLERVAVAEFWDHGESVETGTPQGDALWDDYLAVATGKRTVVAAGDVREIGGVTFEIVAAATDLIDAPLSGAGGMNPACNGAMGMPPVDDENPNSVGFVARFGDFEMLDLGDLTWSYEAQLACPVNLVGPIDLYQTTHHGLESSGAPQLVHGIDPVVVVMNNGAHKGGASSTFDTLHTAPSLPDVWQSHRALDIDDALNSAEELIANLEEGDADPGAAIVARVDARGAITVTNARNAHARDYQAR